MPHRIALSMRVNHASDYADPRDCLSHDWQRYLSETDALPYPIPNLLPDPAGYLEALRPNLLILTGGEDIGSDRARDETETTLLSHALDNGVPVLGVCRGMQLINVHLGGRLATVEGHAAVSHAVSFSEPWHSLYGDSATVNSFHAQGVPPDGAAAELRVAATDGDGNTEAIFHPDKPLAAVMWHPERAGGLDGDRRLLDGLAGKSPPWR